MTSDTIEMLSKIAITIILALLTIKLSNDVQPNPGPKTKYPCGTCEKAVNWNRPAIACDACNKWYHKSCINMASNIFNIMANNDDSWTCCNCGLPSFSSSLFNTTVIGETSSLTSLESSTASSPGIPLHSSSPEHRRSKPRNLDKQSHTKIMVINFQSIKNKIEELNNIFDSSEVDIIIGTETWLNPEIGSSEIFPPYYNVYRRDRKDGYGGVLIAVKSDLTSEQLKQDGNEEIIFVKISNSKEPLIVGGIYRPPSSDIDYMDNICTKIKAISTKYDRSVLWLGGDLNLPDIDWQSESIRGNRYSAPINNSFLDTIRDCNLEQIVDFNTRLETILDIFLTNRPTLVNKCQPLPGVSDHDIVYVDSSIKPNRGKPPRRNIHIWKRADIESMIKDTEELTINFNESYNHHNCIEEMWKFINQSLLQILNKHVPSKMSSTRFHQPWITGEIKRLSRRKKRAYKKARRTQDPRDQDRYMSLKRQTKKACKDAYRSYLHNIISPDQTANPKRFWSFIKGKKCDSMGVAPLRNHDGLIHADKETMANILNQQFSSVFNKNEDVTSIKDKGHSPYESMPKIKVTNPGVAKLLRGLNIHKATGPDNISTRLLKTVAYQVTPMLSTFFQASINQGKIPEQWKEANVVPIFKKGDRNTAANYRPVSLTSVCCKLLEHILCSSIMKHLEKHKILTDAQHGFRKRRSCETQLVLTSADLLKSLDNRGQTDVILLDFSKAFDKVPHQRLLYKIKHYGIRGKTLAWLSDFLKHRSQTVLVEGSKSLPAPVLSGVPQGSVLGPLMFLMYINDLPEYIEHSSVRLIADDCLVYREINNHQDGNMLQEDLNNLQRWESDWQMEFHPQKCQLLRVTNKQNPINHSYDIHGHTLDKVEAAKYLGVTIDRQLNWNTHIASITKKANSTRAFLQRNLGRCPTKIKAICYETMVRPLMEYSSSVWDPWTAANIQQLEAVQRRSARFAFSDYSRLSSVTNMMKQLGWPSLAERRARNKATMLYRIVNHQVAIDPSSLTSTATENTRGHTHKLMVPYARIDALRHSFIPSTIRIWNNLPAHVVEAKSVDMFKSLINKIQIVDARD